MIEIWATSRTYRQSRKYPYVWDSLQHRKPTFWQAHATLSLPTWTLRSVLPLGKLNAVRAAFKAGVTPARIAQEFGIL